MTEPVGYMVLINTQNIDEDERQDVLYVASTHEIALDFCDVNMWLLDDSSFNKPEVTGTFVIVPVILDEDISTRDATFLEFGDWTTSDPTQHEVEVQADSLKRKQHTIIRIYQMVKQEQIIDADMVANDFNCSIYAAEVILGMMLQEGFLKRTEGGGFAADEGFVHDLRERLANLS